MGADFTRLWVASEKILYPGTGGGGEVQVMQLVNKYDKDDC